MNKNLYFPHCLNCGLETRLIMGNPCFSYFLCPECGSKFVMNVFTEKMEEINE